MSEPLQSTLPSPNGRPPVAAGSALRCRGVTAGYGRIEVCHGIDVEVDHGETVLLLGVNGAGKSSFLGALAGQVRGGGEVFVDGSAIDSMSTHRRAEAGLAFVPEGRGNLFPTLSVDENLLLGARLAEPDDREAGREYVLTLFPILAQRLSQEASTLSGGEQQMLAIAMALARRPAVLLLDEPSQGLAPVILRELGSVFARLCADGVGLLVAEQNPQFASDIGDRFAVLSEGELISSGSTDQLDHDALAATYLSAGEEERA